MALFSYPVCTWLCQYVNMGVRKWLEKSAEKQKYKLRKTLNPLSRKAFRAVSFSATKDMQSVLIGSEYPVMDTLLFYFLKSSYCNLFRGVAECYAFSFFHDNVASGIFRRSGTSKAPMQL